MWKNSNHGSENWALKQIASPAREPVTVAEAKAHLRVDFPDDDTYIGGLITAARMVAEERTNRVFVTQIWDYILDDFPRGDVIVIRKPPLQAVSSVNYTDSDGFERLMPATDYVVDINSEPGRIFLGFSKIWPVAILQPASSVRIRFTAGYLDAAVVPQPIKQAILFLISQWYENREPVSKDTLQKVPMTFDYLIGPYRVWRFQ